MLTSMLGFVVGFPEVRGAGVEAKGCERELFACVTGGSYSVRITERKLVGLGVREGGRSYRIANGGYARMYGFWP